ncbi:hypothetical protein BCR36DRAFT_584762 [Piromyces finnis]|uniref:Uncharacterized protein n=1 Tax=Piromyces finnis TaxID=1754191 RepID=A0A1Y1V5G1_9FUNG|nr:hypothetical protein BCR36DRAFT_584762 [Piromyces finnis]|eukprot:ORX47660.1 hypothetical protein BCR36DRAFT_584762 [Piromyces finnis]
MKSSIVVLLFTLIVAAFAEKEIAITEPNQATVWQFGNVYEVKWNTERTGPATLNLIYYEGPDPTQSKDNPFMNIKVDHLEAGSVSFDLRDTVAKIDDVKKQLPISAKKYFLRFDDLKNTGYSPTFTINGGELNDQQVKDFKDKKSGTSSYAYTAVIAIVIGIITTLTNIF